MILADKVALVTGGGSGLGRAISIALASAGASVMVTGRRKEPLSDTVTMIEQQGGTAAAITADLSNESGVTLVVQKTCQRFGSLQILINSAATLGDVAWLTDTSTRDWHKTIATNLTAPFLLSRSALTIMIPQREGRIINLLSDLSSSILPGYGVYSISKAGLTQLTRIWGEEIRRFGITVNGIDPGMVESGIVRDIRKLTPWPMNSDAGVLAQRKEDSIAMQGPGAVSALAVFLASSQAAGISGCVGTLDDYLELGFVEP